MTSKGLERALHQLNGSNGQNHVCVWVDGNQYDVVDVEWDGKVVNVIVSQTARTMDDEKEGRRMD